jgi:hypothetical protein
MLKKQKSREVFLHGFFYKKNRRLSGLPAVFGSF